MSDRDYLLLYTLPIGVPLILIAALLVVISWQLRSIRRAPRRAAAVYRHDGPVPPYAHPEDLPILDAEQFAELLNPPPRRTGVDTRDEERFHLGLLDEDAPTVIGDNRIGKPRRGASIDDDNSRPAADTAAEHRKQT